MDINSNTKPCLVKAGQGFSVLYQNRFLYSKYSPDKAILSAISSIEILPGSLILVFSPCLWLGLDALLSKCDSESLILGIEYDHELFELASSKLYVQDKRVKLLPEKYLSGNGIKDFLNALTSQDSALSDDFILPKRGSLRRVISLDFSAGVSLNRDSFKSFFSLTQNALSSFWKNHLTLVKFSRLYSRNIFKNLKYFQDSFSFQSFFKSVTKPIIIFGAGESIEETISSLENDSDFYIIAVDAAIKPLLENGIHIDAVVAVESQLAIEKAYIGVKPENLPVVFCDLTSRTSLNRRFPNRCFFLSEFDRNHFLKKLQKVLNNPEINLPVLPALGSVGLVASYISLLLRANENVPVYFTGLDFSFQNGKTHAKGTTQLVSLLASMNRFNPSGNYNSTFAPGTEMVSGKSGSKIFTSMNLSNYAKLFTDFFSGTGNFFDAGKSGLKLGIPEKEIVPLVSETEIGTKPFAGKTKAELKTKIEGFLRDEKTALEKLRDLLSLGKESRFYPGENYIEQTLMDLMDGREYLYLHFPDGFSPRTDIGFLKRIRSEIDFYLKDIELSLK